jgi:hypothetical protein
LMKRGNSILAEICLRMRPLLLRTNRMPFTGNQNLRTNLKSCLVHQVLF